MALVLDDDFPCCLLEVVVCVEDEVDEEDCCCWLGSCAEIGVADDMEPVRDSDLTCCISVALGIKSSLDLIVRLVVVVVVVLRSVVVARLEPLKAANGSLMIEPALESGVDSLSALIVSLVGLKALLCSKCV